jgi:glucose/arabinose dehydrogenase
MLQESPSSTPFAPASTETHTPMPSATEAIPVAPTLVTNVGDFPDPSAYTWSLIANGLTRPVDLTHAGDERIFVVEQRGVIWTLDGGNVKETPFLDIQDRVNDRANEQGLLGLAFHPKFSENGYFFVNYTGSDGGTVISRFQVSSDPNRADPTSEFIILTINQPFGNHNGGSLKFGPDSYLYIGTGDGGSANDPQGNGQSLDTLLGKILRIDVDNGDRYSIPEDNPFTDGAGRNEIWAFGLRNPWRISFDRLTGDLYIGDVGQNQWEEIDFQPTVSPGGINYGWNLREGAHPFASEQTQGLTDPIAEYGHGGNCSVTGGFVVRSLSLPAWGGIYLFGDYCTGTVWGLIRSPTGTWEMKSLFQTGVRISSFGEDSFGEIFLVSHGGEIFRLEALS